MSLTLPFCRSRSADSHCKERDLAVPVDHTPSGAVKKKSECAPISPDPLWKVGALRELVAALTRQVAPPRPGGEGLSVAQDWAARVRALPPDGKDRPAGVRARGVYASPTARYLVGRNLAAVLTIVPKRVGGCACAFRATHRRAGEGGRRDQGTNEADGARRKKVRLLALSLILEYRDSSGSIFNPLELQRLSSFFWGPGAYRRPIVRARSGEQHPPSSLRH